MAELERPKKFFSTELKLCKLFVLYPSGGKFNTFYKLMMIICHVLSYTTLIGIVLGLFLNKDGNENISERSTNVLSVVILATCICTRHFMEFSLGKILEVIDYVNETYPFSMKIGQKRISMQKHLKLHNIITLVWGTCPLWGSIAAVIEAIYTRKIVFSSWFPFESLNSPMFEIIVLWQTVAQVTATASFTSLDILYLGFVLMSIGQLQMLNTNLRTLHFRALIEIGEPIDISLLNMNEPNSAEKTSILDRTTDFVETTTRHQDYLQAIKKLLRDSIIHHQNILKCCEMVTNIFSQVLLLKISYNTMVISICCFNSTKTKSNTQRVRLIEYVTLPIFSLFLYGSLGSKMTYQSIEVSNALYSSKWYAFNSSVKSSMMIMMCRANRPLVLTAGKLVGFSLITFRKILRLCYSYVMFLWNMTDQE